MKLLRWFILPPVALLAMVLAVANRQDVTFSLDPFNPTEPALGVTMPLALIVIFALGLGILIGGLAAWRQARSKASRRADPLLPPGVTSGLTGLPAPRD
ncbi:MAG TPA: DUF1049 domain-containing protein [Parvibaculum sp.]